MSENRVVIYSNGIADFQRSYQVSSEEPLRLSLPVRQDHLGDVLASFNIYGNVTLDSPPTFCPANEMEGNISINPQQVLEDLATNLSGAKVQIERGGTTLEGTLVGLHEEEEATTGKPIHSKSIIVLAEDGLRRCPLREIQAFRFLDGDVQAEINKALQRNYQRIKPNSTFVEFVLSTAEEKADTVVQYTIPAAAWKISYRLRTTDERAAELQGFAIVDNNTDEDWNDFRVCVVTGEPITFSTDLAESKIPSREHVALVSESALGAVELEGDRMEMDPEPLRFSAFGAASMRSASTPTATQHEVGDYSIFESESSVTIPAKRSTVIPIFNVKIPDAKPVLHYKHANHAERPYRCVDFVNQSGFSLGRGVCTVFEEGSYSGSCLVSALKSGESQLLPHALETGVRVHRDEKQKRTKLVGLRLSKGFYYSSTRQQRETQYHIKSSRDEPAKLILDHVRTLVEPKVVARLIENGGEVQLEIESRLADGERYAITVAPKSEIIVCVDEQCIVQSETRLIADSKAEQSLNVDWLERSVVKANGPFASDKGVQECLRIQADVETNRQQIAELQSETERLAARQERLRQNIGAGGQDEMTSRWRADLDEAERAIRNIEEERLPGLREEEMEFRSQLLHALKSLSAEWSAEDAG